MFIYILVILVNVIAVVVLIAVVKATYLRRAKEKKFQNHGDHKETYPIKEMTYEEFNQLPRDVGTEFLQTCPIGTWFVCRPEVNMVVGQIVKGDDLFCSQWGAGLSVPERGINRYSVTIVEKI